MNSNKNILLIFGIHTNNKQKYYATLYNIKHLHKYSKKIICIDSNENKNSGLKEKILDLYDSIEFYYLKNNPILLDVAKWIHGLNSENYLEYDYVILVNDSICISRPIADFFEMIDYINAEMYGIIDSFENKYHIQSFLRAFNQSGIKKFISYYCTNNHKILAPLQTTEIFEIEITKIFSNIKSLYSIKNSINRSTRFHKIKNTIKFYIDYLLDRDRMLLKSYNHENLHFNDKQYKYYLFSLNYPIIKLKKVNSYFYPINYNLDENDFNPIEYRNMHWDLCNIAIKDLITHFYQSGIKEGRKYKPTQNNCPPKYLVEYINKNNLDFLLS